MLLRFVQTLLNEVNFRQLPGGSLFETFPYRVPDSFIKKITNDNTYNFLYLWLYSARLPRGEKLLTDRGVHRVPLKIDDFVSFSPVRILYTYPNNLLNQWSVHVELRENQNFSKNFVYRVRFQWNKNISEIGSLL